ncbi:MAG: hypothetical protein K9K21_01950 [Desulfotignum sp.]|nr:hypothetical protein [Desulfotignum sp.]
MIDNPALDPAMDGPSAVIYFRTLTIQHHLNKTGETIFLYPDAPVFKIPVNRTLGIQGGVL